jgi:hypothetical protein
MYPWGITLDVSWGLKRFGYGCKWCLVGRKDRSAVKSVAVIVYGALELKGFGFPQE